MAAIARGCGPAKTAGAETHLTALLQRNGRSTGLQLASAGRLNLTLRPINHLHLGCRCSQVRLAFLDMVGSWLLTLRERRDHEARLLPYVLSGICDEAPAVVSAALQLLDQLGCQYEQDREAELADTLRFADMLENGAEAQLLQLIHQGRVRYAGTWEALPGTQRCASAAPGPHMQHGAQPTHAPPAEPTPDRQQLACAATAAAKQSTMAGLPCEALVLPGPLKERARLGSRLLVRGNISSLLPALCRELSSWQSCPRAMAARLLLVSLLLVESAAEQHLQVLC